MNADRAVKNGLGRAGFHGHRKTLHDFARVRPHHVQADHAVSGVFDDQFQQRAFGAAAQRVFERLEVAAVNADLAEFLARLGLRIAHRANVRMGNTAVGMNS